MPDSDLTQVGIFMGTPGYSPPEAIREGRYTPQADVFAWGAVFYELLSGRIPYEGPDTKTTNSYVVQGNAPPPTRHDPSIPEPLAAVTMAALQPSDRNRFKDASEAEQALREAWDRCLMQGIVHPAVLAMEETSHDKAPVRMHEARGAKIAPMPIMQTDSQEVTAIDSKVLGQPFQIESSNKGRTDDDDPTMLHVRDDIKPTLKTPGAMHAVNDASNVADTKAESPRFTQPVERSTMSKIMWLAIIIVAVATATVGTLYLLGFIK
jgi:serine/threonine-protein kinase